jgi:hypothetical protein
MEAFQLRLWDGRLGRWLTVDPAGQYYSPYVGMGNNPVSHIDPNGGTDGEPGGPGKGFWSGVWSGIKSVFSSTPQTTQNSEAFVEPEVRFQAEDVNVSRTRKVIDNFFVGLGISADLTKSFNVGVLTASKEVRVYNANFNTGNQYMKFYNSAQWAKNATVVGAAYTLASDYTDVLTANKKSEKKMAQQKFVFDVGIMTLSIDTPIIGWSLTAIQLMQSTDTYKEEVHKQQEQKYEEENLNVPSEGLNFGPWDGKKRNSLGIIID